VKKAELRLAGEQEWDCVWDWKAKNNMDKTRIFQSIK
jgi:hypothetical protein